MKYAHTSNNAWKSSAIRIWLKGSSTNENNDKFVNVFSTEEEKILSVKIENLNDQNKNSSEIIDSSGEDKIFLLSSADVYSYFNDKSVRKAWYLNESPVVWWLRSPSGSSTILLISVAE